MPHSAQLEGAQRPVVPLMHAGLTVAGKRIADRLPARTSVPTGLDDLPGPVTRLGGIDPGGVCGRSRQVVDLPTAEVRSGDAPLLRASSAVRMKAPFFVPMRSRTPLIGPGHGRGRVLWCYVGKPHRGRSRSLGTGQWASRLSCWLAHRPILCCCRVFSSPILRSSRREREKCDKDRCCPGLSDSENDRPLVDPVRRGHTDRLSRCTGHALCGYELGLWVATAGRAEERSQ